jgi:hypothetical protein
MPQFTTIPARPRNDRGIASVLLLFAMSAFSVLGVAALTTNLADAPSGKTFRVLTGMEQDNQTKFVAPITVPDSWRLKAGDGVYAFQLPVIVPETGNEESGATAAWHTMTESEVPGLTVCCATRGDACRQRKAGSEIADWTPSANDTRWLSLRLATRPDSAGKTDLITATILSAASNAEADTSTISCQLEFQDAIVAKGTAYLRQVPRQQVSAVPTDLVEGTLNLAVRMK